MTFIAVILVVSQISGTVLAAFDDSGCGKEKGCVQRPEGCETSKTCTIQFSFKAVGDDVEMELFGKPPDGDAYIAAGFSKDQKMANTTVVYCARVGGNVKGGLARTVPAEPPIKMLNNTGIQDVKTAEEVDGGLHCKINQRIKPGNSEVYDLDEQYYILLAMGRYNAEANRLRNHGPNGRWIGPKMDPKFGVPPASGDHEPSTTDSSDGGSEPGTTDSPSGHNEAATTINPGGHNGAGTTGKSATKETGAPHKAGTKAALTLYLAGAICLHYAICTFL